MMGISDIIELILLCAVIFIPLGYNLHRWLPKIRRMLPYTLLKPRYVKPAGVLRRGVGNKIEKAND
ncbi:membrane protein [Salmonella enterica subsp. enterica serovar Choleraesuis]|nr:membrane protein [Salmonella enterica subsp. enterica serovar Choleraesuis]